jgi:hypothetical protein
MEHWLRLQGHRIIRNWIMTLERLDERVHPYKHRRPWNVGD